ncbi:MAG: hypothetical protein RIQ47_1039 [Bacteroidota bacterium]|jgi:uncharacterized membrane protein YfcA
MTVAILIGCFFLVAALYSSVGHGGASGYLAVMAIIGLSPEIMRPTALVLNLLVSFIATGYFFRSGHFRSRLFLPLVLSSVPFAWLGANLPLPDYLYKIILGICLLVAVLRLLLEKWISTDGEVQKISVFWLIIMGCGIGIISGMIGIGGGILLSPLLLLGRWATLRESAALAAPFIFFNSISAFSVLYQKQPQFPDELLYWMIATLAGGIVGSYAGSRRLPVAVLKYILAGVLLLAAGKLMFV